MQFKRLLFHGVCALAWGWSILSPAQFNSWTNPASAQWQANYWSLGILPAVNQSVTLTNSGFKAVEIAPSTAASFPDSLTVSNLTINAPTNGYNTLLLNYSGSAVPLHVRNALTVGTNAALLNLFAGLQVDGVAGGGFNIQGGQLSQESSTTVATNVTTSAIGGNMNLTNASSWFGPVILGDASSAGNITQSGGVVTCSNLTVVNGSYNLLR